MAWVNLLSSEWGKSKHKMYLFVFKKEKREKKGKKERAIYKILSMGKNMTLSEIVHICLQWGNIP